MFSIYTHKHTHVAKFDSQFLIAHKFVCNNWIGLGS